MNANCSTQPLDLELIAQRILKLAEIATLDHLESVSRSQAEGLIEMSLSVEKEEQEFSRYTRN